MADTKITFDPGLVTAAGLTAMAEQARADAAKNDGVSASHYVAWVRLAEALEAARDSQIADPERARRVARYGRACDYAEAMLGQIEHARAAVGTPNERAEIHAAAQNLARVADAVANAALAADLDTFARCSVVAGLRAAVDLLENGHAD